MVDGTSSGSTTVLSGVPQSSVLGQSWAYTISSLYQPCFLPDTDGSKLTIIIIIILYKPINHPEDYRGLQSDIDAI